AHGGKTGCAGELALGVLRRLASLLEAVLLALGLARVAGQQTRLLQRRAPLGVLALQAPGDAAAQGAGLPGHAAAGDACDDVEAALGLGGPERLPHVCLERLDREVVLQRAAVELEAPRARDDADPCHRALAPAGEDLGCHLLLT